MLKATRQLFRGLFQTLYSCSLSVQLLHPSNITKKCAHSIQSLRDSHSSFRNSIGCCFKGILWWQMMSTANQKHSDPVQQFIFHPQQHTRTHTHTPTLLLRLGQNTLNHSFRQLRSATLTIKTHDRIHLPFPSRLQWLHSHENSINSEIG